MLDGMGFKAGDICYILESNRRVRQAKVAGKSGEFYTIQLVGSCGAIRLKESRLFGTGKRQIASTVTFSGGCFAATDI